MTGKIFDIQRFSIYDGPGIRTNVFLKGCNLRCLWCHNPESQLIKNELMFFENKCKGCGKCSALCNKTFTPDCIACGKCADICLHGAREIAGQDVDTAYVITEVLKDKAFYDTSGGGVTLSGGEPLLQIDFAAEILKKCKEAGLDTAIETAGNVPWEYFEKILPCLDHVLYDIKCIDSEKHKKLTGVYNDNILANAEKLKSTDIDIIFRMPLIPTLNDDEAEKAAEFVAPKRLELLAYHSTGCSKYKALNKEYTISDITPPTKEYMQVLAEKINAEYSPTGI